MVDLKTVVVEQFRQAMSEGDDAEIEHYATAYMARTTGKTTFIPIKKIRTGHHREWIDPKRVKLYRQMLRAGERAPPLLLGEPLPDGRWQLFDGFQKSSR
jgi:hypothetical protein